VWPCVAFDGPAGPYPPEGQRSGPRLVTPVVLHGPRWDWHLSKPVQRERVSAVTGQWTPR